MNESKENTEREIQRDREYEERWGRDPQEVKRVQDGITIGSEYINAIFKNPIYIRSDLKPWISSLEHYFRDQKHEFKIDILIAFIKSTYASSDHLEIYQSTSTIDGHEVEVTEFLFNDRRIAVGNKVLTEAEIKS